MKIVLHIGMAKTGTSSIQKFCQVNRAELAGRGVCYPEAGSDIYGNHVKLAAFAQDDGRATPLRKDLALTSPRELKRFRKELLRELAVELNGAAAHTVFLSNEHCSLLVNESEVERLASLLHAFSGDVRILVYLRRQMEAYVAMYATRAVRGESPFPLDLTPEAAGEWRFDYLAQLDRWAKYFGRKNVIVRPFEREQLAAGDVVADCLHVLGAEGGAYAEVERQNKRASKDCVQFMELLFRHLPRFAGDGVHPYHRNIGDLVKSVAGGEPFRVPHLQALEPVFDETNAQVARLYLGREDGVLFRRPPKPAGEEPEPLSVEKAVEIAARLWVEQHKVMDGALEELCRYRQLFQQLQGHVEAMQAESARAGGGEG